MSHLCATFVLSIFTSLALAQHGMIERPGLYNFPYHGDTWTGIITTADPQHRQLTLSYSNKTKTEDFTAAVLRGAKLEDENGQLLTNPDVKIGDKVMVYYIEKGRTYFTWDDSHRKQEVKATEDTIFRIRVFPKKR